MAYKPHTSHAKYNNTELYSIGNFHYLGDNGKLYLLNQQELEKVLKEMGGMTETEKYTHLRNAIDENRFKKF
jgi:hypothetical protein